MKSTTNQSPNQSPWPFMPAFATGYIIAIVTLVALIAAAGYFFNWSPPATSLTVIPVLSGLCVAAYRWAKRIARIPTNREKFKLAAASTLVALVLSVLQIVATSLLVQSDRIDGLLQSLKGGPGAMMVYGFLAFVVLIQFAAMYFMYGSMARAYLKNYDGSPKEQA